MPGISTPEAWDSHPWLSLSVFQLWVINASFERVLFVLCWVQRKGLTWKLGKARARREGKELVYRELTTLSL